MRIVFTTEHRNAPSTILNLSCLKELGAYPDVTFTAFPEDLSEADVILFMGYDPDIRAARAASPNALVGIIDPRPGTLVKAAGADFLMVNGPEMAAMSQGTGIRTLFYPIYKFEPRRQQPPNEDRIIICYHGNAMHAAAMHPQITTALDAVWEDAADIGLSVAIRYIYNIAAHGKISSRFLPSRMPVEHVQWHDAVYARELAASHIGIVPNLVPMRWPALCERISRIPSKSATWADCLVRYKPTSNPGRIISFAMHGIPVVADLYPSSAKTIEPGVSGFLAMDTRSWHLALLALVTDIGLRTELGDALHLEFLTNHAPPAINARFMNFIKRLFASARHRHSGTDGGA